MKVLLLGGTNNIHLSIYSFLCAAGESVECAQKRITLEDVEKFNPDIIVSYNYRYILPGEIIAHPRLGAINLHISYLPWNRGADPNFWSHLEHTTKGVTIHYIDEGVDTGDIISQKKVCFSGRDTLRTSYTKLHFEIQKLFKDWWLIIKSGTASRKKQSSVGSLHLSKDKEKFKFLIEKNGWDTPIRDLDVYYNNERDRE